MDRDWISDIKIERRNCGKARSITIIVEPPKYANYKIPRYNDLVSLAVEVYQGAMAGDGRIISSADVMAWSDHKRKIGVPDLYRVTAAFAYPEDLKDAETEE